MNSFHDDVNDDVGNDVNILFVTLTNFPNFVNIL